MTLENFNVKKDMVSRYFHRDKWKDEAGVFQYPRGKKRTDAIMESLEIVFDKEEFAVEKELTLRGDNVLGNVFVISVVMDDKSVYMALTITDHLFALIMLPDNCIDAFSFMAKAEEESDYLDQTKVEEAGKAEEAVIEANISDSLNKEEKTTVETATEESLRDKSESDSFGVEPIDEKEAEKDRDESVEEEIDKMMEELPYI